MDPFEVTLFAILIGLQSLTLQQILQFQHRLDAIEIRVQTIEKMIWKSKEVNEYER
mgnify:CR=1 FL=1